MTDYRLTVLEVLPLVNEYYSIEGNEVGGSFHIVLDDGNCEKSYVEYCINEAEKRKDIAGIVLGKILMQMSYTQRLKLFRDHV